MPIAVLREAAGTERAMTGRITGKVVPACPRPTSTPAVSISSSSLDAKRVPIMPSTYSTTPSAMVRPEP